MKKVLENIPKLYVTKSENYMFNGCMHSLMVHLQEDVAYDFSFFAGVTGDMFSQQWSLSPRFSFVDTLADSSEFSNAGTLPFKPMQLAFDACGYNYEYIIGDEIRKDEAKWFKKIIWAIDRGYPVLSFGVVGPPVCSIICGYDEEGDTLIGWAQFQEGFDPKADGYESNGYFRKHKGVKNSEGLVFVGEQKEKVSIPENYRKAIMRIPEFAFMPEIETRSFGKQAFDDWADALLSEELFSEERMADRCDAQESMYVIAATNSYYIPGFLKKAAELCPDLQDKIERMLKHYHKYSEAIKKLEVLGVIDLKEEEHRNMLSDCIREMGEGYAKAAAVLLTNWDRH
ncbi:MAG: hypothetical protein ACYDEX_24670 [Mobilitalea sp.]